MASAYIEDESETLSSKFDELLKEYKAVDNLNVPTNSDEAQERICKAISRLEEVTIHVSQIGIFSSNESIEELSTNSLKFLLLPFLLGSISLKKCNLPREEVIHLSSIYFKDYIGRCKEYGFTDLELPQSMMGSQDEDESKEIDISRNFNPGKPTAEDLLEMGHQRAKKIKRFKQKKELADKVQELNKIIEGPSVDEDILRDYYTTLIQQFCYDSLSELDSLSMESIMLNRIKVLKSANKDLMNQEKVEKMKPLRPFLLTRSEAGKHVFGAGYPSLPSMTVEEFYEQRVKDGWFPSKSERNSLPNNTKNEEEEEKEEQEENDDGDDDDATVKSLRERDEWRDMHRRGWGNTYNRS